MIDARVLASEIEGNFFKPHNYGFGYQQHYPLHGYQYDPLVGLTYTDGQMIYTLSKNVAVYEAFKEQGSPGAAQTINENFSMLQILTE